MKTKLLFKAAGLLIIIVFLVSCKNKNLKADDNKTQITQKKDSTDVAYYCTIDTMVISATPGKCPQCGKDLVRKPIKTVCTSARSSSNNKK